MTTVETARADYDARQTAYCTLFEDVKTAILQVATVLTPGEDTTTDRTWQLDHLVSIARLVNKHIQADDVNAEDLALYRRRLVAAREGR